MPRLAAQAPEPSRLSLCNFLNSHPFRIAPLSRSGILRSSATCIPYRPWRVHARLSKVLTCHAMPRLVDLNLVCLDPSRKMLYIHLALNVVYMLVLYRRALPGMVHSDFVTALLSILDKHVLDMCRRSALDVLVRTHTCTHSQSYNELFESLQGAQPHRFRTNHSATIPQPGCLRPPRHSLSSVKGFAACLPSSLPALARTLPSHITP